MRSHTRRTQYQIEYQSDSHPKGPDFWQKTREVFTDQQKAEARLAHLRTTDNDRYRLLVKQPPV